MSPDPCRGSHNESIIISLVEVNTGLAETHNKSLENIAETVADTLYLYHRQCVDKLSLLTGY